MNLQKLLILFSAHQIQPNLAESPALKPQFSRKIIVTTTTILLSLLFCYNSFVLERFLMGQERIFWAYFLVLPYIYHLFSYIEAETKKTLKTKTYLILIPTLMALFNIHVMILSTLIGLSFGLVTLKKHGRLIFFSLLNLLLIGLSLVLNYDFLNAQNSNFYFNNIASNSV